MSAKLTVRKESSQRDVSERQATNSDASFQQGIDGGADGVRRNLADSFGSEPKPLLDGLDDVSRRSSSAKEGLQDSRDVSGASVADVRAFDDDEWEQSEVEERKGLGLDDFASRVPARSALVPNAGAREMSKQEDADQVLSFDADNDEFSFVDVVSFNVSAPCN